MNQHSSLDFKSWHPSWVLAGLLSACVLILILNSPAMTARADGGADNTSTPRPTFTQPAAGGGGFLLTATPTGPTPTGPTSTAPAAPTQSNVSSYQIIIGTEMAATILPFAPVSTQDAVLTYQASGSGTTPQQSFQSPVLLFIFFAIVIAIIAINGLRRRFTGRS